MKDGTGNGPGAGALFVWRLSSDEADTAAARLIEPAHLLVALCTLCDWQPEDGADLEPAVADELAKEAGELRARFIRAGIDPFAFRRRIRRRMGIDPADAVPSSGGLLHRSSATHAIFARAADLAEWNSPRVAAVHLLRAVLESPEPVWTHPASALGVDDLLAACFPPGDTPEPVPGTAFVRFEVTAGERAGRVLTFVERSRLIIGRAGDCHLTLSDDLISRHHCLVEVNPPEARLRDLGSRNGTWVNGERLGVGQVDRDRDLTRVASAERDLVDGDLIKLGDRTVLAVRVAVPPAPADVTRAAPPTPVGRPEPVAGRRRPTLMLRSCPVCGDEIGRSGVRPLQDPELCVPCDHDPDRIMRLIGEQVDRGVEKPGLFDGYTVLRRVGVGGMGAVYLARDEQSGEQLALKIMMPHVPGIEKAEQIFLREGANSKLLRHRHIVRQREHGRWHGLFYIAMDFCEGGDITGLLHRYDGRLAVGRAVRITVQALEALEYAHRIEVPVRLPGDRIMVASGLVHRDISPGNLLFSQGVVKLADFGLSKAFDAAGLSGITRDGTAAGKPRFVPRQQVVDYRGAGPAVDVWSVAACLYYMLTGSPPREFGPFASDWMVVLESAPVPIRDRDPSVPPGLAAVIDHALTDEPEIGFSTAEEFREALLAVRP